MRFPRVRLFGFGAFFLFSTTILGVSQHQGPSGNRWPDSTANSGFHVETPQVQGGRSINPAKLRADAAELQSLIGTVQAQVDQVAKGMIPKDASDNLRKIEKLAKHLRSEINP